MQRQWGLPTREAVVKAGATRFRPVMLTAVTTILGLVPMAVGISFDFRKFHWIFDSDSSQWWGPMAVAVIFGLSVATLLTLFVVPSLYVFFDDMKIYVGKLLFSRKEKTAKVKKPRAEKPAESFPENDGITVPASSQIQSNN